MMKTFRDIVENNINHENWKNLKAFMKSQNLFDSWRFEGDYEELIISFKQNIQAINALKNSTKGTLDINAFGNVSCSDKEIRVELNNDAQKALES